MISGIQSHTPSKAVHPSCLVAQIGETSNGLKSTQKQLDRHIEVMALGQKHRFCLVVLLKASGQRIQLLWLSGLQSMYHRLEHTSEYRERENE